MRLHKLFTPFFTQSIKQDIKQRMLNSALPMWRSKRNVTRILGPFYNLNHKKIEIDITYSCNLGCINCNRSVPQAPGCDQMSVEQIHHFVNESIRRKKRWEHIGILGGEPTLHPQLLEIVDILRSFRSKFSPRTKIGIFTNGYNRIGNQIMAKLPSDVIIIDSSKTSSINDNFISFNIAPIDLKEYEGIDFTNGCRVAEVNGIGLNKFGYYPCAVAGSIDRVFGFDIGRKSMPQDKDPMMNELRQFCQLCGHFKRSNIYLNKDNPELASKSWKNAYALYESKEPELSPY